MNFLSLSYQKWWISFKFPIKNGDVSFKVPFEPPNTSCFRLLRVPNTSSVQVWLEDFGRLVSPMKKKPVKSSIGFFEKSAFRFQASNFRGSMASDTELTQQVPKWTAKSLGASTRRTRTGRVWGRSPAVFWLQLSKKPMEVQGNVVKSGYEMSNVDHV